ncbi:DNA pilot protein [Dipodfec virus RodF1_47]|uniref:DNA pilot protein n=1 Tax=Dipodfec virus RodF1_47 TaxID=2929298 RepID=A0A976N2R2_9VIRU|nr:DNA pilot protein [Dipodfec virus RodF1_47]
MGFNVGKLVGSISKGSGGIPDPVSAAIGTVGAIAGAFSSGGGTNVADSKRLARYNMELNKEYTTWLNENSYSQMRKGLENANYNPLMALGASPQQGSVGGSTATENGQVNPLNAITALNTVANTKNLNANSNLQNQQAETEIAKRENLKADTGMKLVDTMYKKGMVTWQERQNYADLVLKHTQSMMNTASAKYTNERSRGFHYSESHTNTAQSHSWHAGPFGTSDGETPFSRSYSKSW